MSTEDNSSGRQGIGQDRTQRTTTEAPKDVVQKTVNEAKEVADEAIHTAKDSVDDLSAEASRIASEARDKAMSFADENKRRAADQISGVTMALKKAADELENNDQQQVARYARDFAGGLEKVSTNLRDKGVDELAGTVNQFARSQPAMFIGAAALLGFAASRFVRSSSSPRHGDTARSGVTTTSSGLSGQTGAAGTGYGNGPSRKPSAASVTPAYSPSTDNRNGLGSSFSRGE